MKTAQDILGRYTGGRLRGGFNSRLFGDTYSQVVTDRDQERLEGWECANDMIKQGKLFHVHNFHTHSDCKGHAFTYGGKWACNTCNNAWIDPKWWIIKVTKENDKWCCVGEGFVSQSLSTNYAIGDTREDAIRLYGDICCKMPVIK